MINNDSYTFENDKIKYTYLDSLIKFNYVFAWLINHIVEFNDYLKKKNIYFLRDS